MQKAERISEATIRKYSTVTEAIEICDTEVRALRVRFRPGGEHAYRVRVGGKGNQFWFTIGRVDDPELTPHKARAKAQKILADWRVARIDPRAAKIEAVAAAKRAARESLTFNEYFDKVYTPHATATLKSAKVTLFRIKSQFGKVLGHKPLTSIDAALVLAWRDERLNEASIVTANKDLAALRSCLSEAFRRGLIDQHPLARVKQLKTDPNTPPRFLTADEIKTLRRALDARDRRLVRERERFNKWRRARHQDPLPVRTYGDHLTPLVLLALNTGARLSELLQLAWSDVDLVERTVTFRGEGKTLADGTKSCRTRHVPLTNEAVAVFKAWRLDGSGDDDPVFPGPDGQRLHSINTSWQSLKDEAGLKAVRFHDLRHHYASTLVQRKVELPIVRELLGHSDYKLTLRYARFALGHLKNAVAVLDEAEPETKTARKRAA